MQKIKNQIYKTKNIMATNQAVKTSNNIIMSSELEHYITLDEMHQRLVAVIRNHFAKK